MIVRPAARADFPAWATMRRSLWPDEGGTPHEAELEGLSGRDPPYVGFVADAGGVLVGFVEVAVRSYAEGAPPGPVAYVEGIWVEPGHRRRGVARALLAAAEQRARDRGLSHLGSDALLDNDLSHQWHRAAGFEEVERLVVFGKSLA